MQKVKIITDSTAYLTKEQLAAYDITMVPLAVNLGNENFKEGEKYTNHQFFDKLRESKELFPTTSQPAAGEFKEAYETLSKEAESVVAILISSGISGTVQAAQTGAGLAEGTDVTVIDSYSTAGGLAFMVLEAASMAREGKGKEEIITTVEHMRDTLSTLFMVDTFEYLKRGGRIGGAQALVGTLLKIKPILYIRGKIDVFQKVRTRQKALGRVVEELDEFLKTCDINKARVAVLLVDCQDEAVKFGEQIKAKYPHLEFEYADIGPVVGSHVGPGTMGLAFCSLP
ncbi:DegV family protein [Metallumcola ferriviriculae]|uniref:DegV family protein n=1 Tax=Metallumcola ferriviriculae TaxID=3039180 RepID=A0AAU0UN32_9FIRM|nr:DegV family protein [Desulfitibacteraceae bacterium MK1]